jgi:DNA polymerase-3 subunit beta
MKVICDRTALLDAVNLVSGVVATRSPRPQLMCILLTAENDARAGEGQLTLAATDGEISIRMATSQVEVQDDGATLIPADKLRQIVSAQDNEPTLTLESDGEATHIRGQDAHFKVYGYPAADFPDLPDMPVEGDSFAIGADTLEQLIDRTIFSTARENSRYAINGVLLHRETKKIQMVATDGRRLAVARATADDAPDSESNCIIPSKALTTARKLVASAGGDVRCAVTPSQVVFHFEDGDGEGTGTVLSSNLVEGTFPPYEDVIPKDQDKKATFNVDMLSSAVKRAALLTNEESRGVRMAFGKDAQALKLSSRAPEMGEAEINVGMDAYDGDDIEIGFNPAFITDALKIIDNDQVILEMKAPNKPGLIKSGADFVYVVMPVNLQ